MRNLLILLAVFLSASQLSKASTNVSGQIRTNTTWNKAGSPYMCSGTVEVAPSVTLTIDPGTIIILDQGLDVHGKIDLIATQTDSIFITSNNGSIIKLLSAQKTETMKIEYCKFEKVGFNTGDAIKNLQVTNTVFKQSGLTYAGDTGSLNVTNSLIDGGIYIDQCYKSPVNISNNSFTGFGNYSVYGYASEKTVISGNFFSNSTCAIGYECNEMEISNNTFYNHKSYGISYSKGRSGKWKVIGNKFINNGTAIFVYFDNIEITNNEIHDNKIGVEIRQHTLSGSKLLIENNCIYDNNDSNIFVNCEFNYNLFNNWWGTTDSSKIALGIIDYQDDFKKGAITYSPFLKDANGCKSNNPPTGIFIPEKAEASVSVYPNPFSNNITIGADRHPITRIMLLDITGRNIYTSNYNAEYNVTIQAENIPAGMYMYSITLSDNSVLTGKVSKL